MGKLAVLQMADTPQAESTAVMLRAAGYTDIKVCGPELRSLLTKKGCDTVLAVSQMVSLGYDPLIPSITEATPEDMEKCDLFVEIKVRNVGVLWGNWPRLKGRTLWWRVNGAQPEICPKGGDEVNLICPVATACLWYGVPRYKPGAKYQAQSSQEHEASNAITWETLQEYHRTMTMGDNGMAYTFWPPYPRDAEYQAIDRSSLRSYEHPYSLCHSGRAWGYGPIVDECVKMGVRFYGNNSPHGQISHSQVKDIAKNALCLVHLKSVDCPGWALYEAILSGCPVVTPRLTNSRMLAYDLLQDGKTCLEYGVPASLDYGRGPMEYERCIEDIRLALESLSDPWLNRKIGEAGRIRLNQLMWRADRDGAPFCRFMERHYGA